MKSNYNLFFSKHPSLYYSLMALLGAYGVFLKSPWIVFPLAALFLFDPRRFFYGSFSAAAAALYINYTLVFPHVPPEGVAGTFIFSPSSIRTTQSHFGSQWLYQGTATIAHLGKNFPCSIKVSKKKGIDRPLADCNYLIEGSLRPSYGSSYLFQVKETSPWLPIIGTSSWAEQRFHLKESVKRYIYRHFTNPRTSEFLSGILTGDFEDRIMRQEFGRAGLQHIMAISGFHFAIIAASLLMVLRLFFSPKKAISFLIFLLSSYFLFLGPGASIFRAWVMSLIAVSAVLVERTPSALNSLGLALIGILIVDPVQVLSLGFTFSFAVTAAILIFYSPCKELLESVLTTRTFSEMRVMTLLDQHSYVLITFFKDAIALSLAVNLIALPMTLFYFGKFPVLSLFYNLLIPFMTSITMLLFLAGLICPLIHPINAAFTHFMLNLIYNVPAPLHITLRFSLSPSWLSAYLTLIFLLGILLWQKRNSSEKLYPFMI